MAVHSELRRLLAHDLVPEAAVAPLGDLRNLRLECSEAEGDVSFVRRVAQGRLDVLGHETRRRADRRTNSSEGYGNALIYDLPEILSEGNGSAGAAGRHVSVHEPGELAQGLLGELDGVVSPSELASVEELDSDRLAVVIESLSSFEVDLSGTRRRLHERIDSIQGEIARRYRDGEASIETLLK